MVVFNGKDRIAFENLDLERLSYADLQEVKKQLTKNLGDVKNRISDMEMCPKYDEEIGAWSEAEYLRKQEAAEKSYETEW